MKRVQIQVVSLFILLVKNFAVLTAMADEPVIPRKLAPRVIPTADELANPHLYRPTVSSFNTFMPLWEPPPTDSVRPGEFDPADATIISIMNFGPAFTNMWVDMMRVYSKAAYTWIVANPPAYADTFKQQLDAAGISEDTYGFLYFPADSHWIRDYGPEFVYTDNGRYILDANYSWRQNDDVVPARVGASDWLNTDGTPVPVHQHEHSVAGGNIMTDGAGTCFFSNIIYGYEKPAGWTNEQVDEHMRLIFGCQQIITLKPICMDSTGHIDLYAKLVGPRSILLVEFPEDTTYHGQENVNYPYKHCPDNNVNDRADMEDNLATLEATTNVAGEPWIITRIPILEPYKETYGQDDFYVYRSYLNSQIVNDYVAMPSYYDPQVEGEDNDYLLDKEAEAIAAYMTARPSLIEVAPIDADLIIGDGGAMHCISHEIPADLDADWTAPEAYCGDGIVNGDEECEDDDFGGTTCTSLGYEGGILSCEMDCVLNTDKCTGEPSTDDNEGTDSADDTEDTDSQVESDTETDTDTQTDEEVQDDDDDDDGCGCTAVGNGQSASLVQVIFSVF